MDGGVLAGVLAWALLALTPVALLALLLHGEAVLRCCHRLLRACPHRRPVAPLGRPLQLVAADLRRLYPQAHHPVRGTGMAKQRGTVLAYDEHLGSAATALRVPTTLLDLPVGTVDRELERLRLEHALVRAGLVLSP